MAIEVEKVVKLTDDLDGSTGPDVATRTFTIDGDTRQIELSEANWAQLRASVEPFVAKSRKATGRNTPKMRTTKTRPGGPVSDAAVRKLNKAIRAWAKTQPEYADLPPSGRLGEDVKKAYMAAQADAEVRDPQMALPVADPHAVPAF